MEITENILMPPKIFFKNSYRELENIGKFVIIKTSGNKNIKMKGGQIMALSNEDKIFISQLLDAKIKPVQLVLENDVLPRLQNIESCYTSTYHRYANGMEQLEAMQMDIDVMKKILEEHSEKLQKIS